MKYMKIFHFVMKPLRVTAISTLFVVSEDVQNTKEDIGKFMKNALYVLWHTKRHY